MGAFSLKLPHCGRESALLFNLELLFPLIDTTAVNAPHPNIHTVRSIALLCSSKKKKILGMIWQHHKLRAIMELWPLCADAIVGTAPSLWKCSSSHTTRNGTSIYWCSELGCVQVVVFPQKEMWSTLLTPLGVLEYALITYCTYKKGAEMSPFELAMFLSHILTNVWMHQVS